MPDTKSKPPAEIHSHEMYFVVRLNGRLPQETRIFDEEVANPIKADPKPVIVECDSLEELNSTWMRSLTVLSHFLKSAKKGICLVGANAQVVQMLRQAALLDALPMTNSTRAALVEFGIAEKRRIDVNFINPFLVATIRVLEIQAQIVAKPGQPYRRGANERYMGDISGVIGLVSESFNGAVVLSFPEKTFLAIMSKMLGEPYTELTQDLTDGAGELTNIIFGQAKVTLNDKGFNVKTAIPTVVWGKDHSVQYTTKGPRVALPFESTAGPFIVEICLSE